MILKLLPLGGMCWRCSMPRGLTGAEEQNVREAPLEGSALEGRQAVIVAPCGEDTGAEAAALEALRQGTPVVFLRPSAETAAELGISKKQRRTANEAYIAPERDHPLWFAAVGDFLQFHGVADMYAEFGGRERVLAWIAGRDWALPYPAIVTGSYGAGRFAVFTYDLARVYRALPPRPPRPSEHRPKSGCRR